MAYKIEIRSAAQKQMLSLPKEAQARISLSIDSLGESPRPPGAKKLVGSNLWRIRVGRYRVVYAVADDAQLVTVVRVAWRKEDNSQ